VAGEWNSKPAVSEQAHKQRRTTPNSPSLKILTAITEGAIGSIWEQVWTTKSAYFSKNSKTPEITKGLELATAAVTGQQRDVTD
jgi:hypothetical protein